MKFFKPLIFLFLLTPSLFAYSQTAGFNQVLQSRIYQSTYVWGFVRYHSTKKTDWNKQFNKLYKKSNNAKSNEQLNGYLNKWIEKYYVKNSCEGFIRDSSIVGLQWFIKFSSFRNVARDSVSSIYKPNYLLPDYFSEIEKHSDKFPDEKSRVLALTKIYYYFLYFYPHFDISVNKWDSIRYANIPIFTEANTPLKYTIAIHQLLAHFNDGHISVSSKAINQSFLKYTCPFRAHLSKTSAIIQYLDKDSFCLSNDIRLKDEIVKINGQNITDRYAFWIDKLPHSNIANFLQIAERYVLSDSVPKMNLTIKRGDSIMDKNIPLFEQGSFVTNYHSTSYKIISDTVGWINLSVLKREEAPTVSKILNSTKVLVIDARAYPNSTIDLLCSWLMTEPQPFAIFTNPQKNCLGEFIEGDTVFTEYNSKKPYEGKLIIISDASSVSQSEYSILALKTYPNSILIGEHTGGTAGYTTTFYLPGGIVCRMPVTSFRGINLKVQGTGIQPDITLEIPIEFGENKEERIWEFLLSKIAR